MSTDISMVIPTIGPRRAMLGQALRTVGEQTLLPDTIIVSDDVEHLGGPATRQAGLDRVVTGLVAFLDDDDLLYPHHLETLVAAMEDTGADVIYPWFVCTGNDPFPQFFGEPFDPEFPHLFPITYLARTQVVRDAGGFAEGAKELYGHEQVAGEDWRAILGMVKNRAKIVHVPVRTWVWQHHGGNTSGLPWRVQWT